MRDSHFRSNLTLLAMVVSTFLLALPVSAELPEANWTEWCIAEVDGQRDNQEGETASNPETIAAGVHSSSASVTSSVIYNSSGPPAVTSELTGSAELPVNLFGLADSRITWHIQIVPKTTPPAPEMAVPIEVTVSGWASATGTPETRATSAASLHISIGTIGDVAIFQAIAGSVGASEMQSLDREIQTFSVLPLTQVDGTMAAYATIGLGGTAGSGTVDASAYIEYILGSDRSGGWPSTAISSGSWGTGRRAVAVEPKTPRGVPKFHTCPSGSRQE